MVGDAETTTPPEGGRAFAAKMQERGLRCRLEIYRGRRHGFFNPRGGNEYYWQTLKATEKFLKELWCL